MVNKCMATHLPKSPYLFSRGPKTPKTRAFGSSEGGELLLDIWQFVFCCAVDHPKQLGRQVKSGAEHGGGHAVRGQQDHRVSLLHHIHGKAYDSTLLTTTTFTVMTTGSRNMVTLPLASVTIMT